MAYTRALYDRGFSDQEVADLFAFIDWIMTLPEDLKKSFSQRVIEHEEAKKMKYVTGVEELLRERCIKEGMEKGLERGMEKGMEKGVLKGAREMLTNALETKYATVPERIVSTISRIESLDVLKYLHKQVILATSLDQFEAEFQNWAVQ